MSTDSRSVIQKADMVLSDLEDGGKLNPTQSNEFFQMVMDEPTLLNDIRSIQMPSPQYNIDKIGFGSRMLRAAPSNGNALPAEQRYRPTFDQVQLNAVKAKATVPIPYDVLEDNIERDQLRQTIMRKISQRASLDLEEVVINGDTTSNDAYLALVDGVLQLAGHPVDGSGLSSIDKTVFKNSLDNMPTKYMRQLDQMRFWMSYHNQLEYRDSLADRGTDLGDITTINRPEVPAFGVPTVPAALMPSTNMLLTYPQNIIIGLHRDVMIETDKDIENEQYIVVLTIRFDVKMEEPDAAVVVNGLNV